MLYICKLSNRENLYKMKKYFVISFWLLCLHHTFAQRHEIGVRAGIGNLVGDIGKTNFIQKPSGDITNTPISMGISYKRNFNPYQGVKLSLGYNYVYFDDSHAPELYRNLRKMSGSNEILEAGLTFEYNFYPINNEVRGTMFSPYIFGGISGIMFDTPQLHFVVSPSANGYSIRPYEVGKKKKTSMGIPFGIGLKYKFNLNWAIYGELTFRPTFTDDLDYNDISQATYSIEYRNITEANLPSAVEAFSQYIDANKIGNLNSKDWLNSITIGVSYSFGRPPCYCD